MCSISRDASRNRFLNRLGRQIGPSAGCHSWAVSKVALRVGLSLCLVLLGGLGRPTAAAAGDGPGNLWQSFIVGEGLPSVNILSIATAQDGTLWFGTDAGVGRYDGQWRLLPGDEKALSGRIRAIVQTEDGALWFGTDTGLVRRAPDGDVRVWTTREGLPDNDVRTLTIQARSSAAGAGSGMWVGTKRGLAHLDGERVVIDSPVADADLQATAAAPDGGLLASVAGMGIWRRDRDGRWQRLGGDDLEQAGAVALWAGRDGRIWAGTTNGLNYYQDGVWHSFLLSEEEDHLSVLSLAQDRDGALWAGTESGVFYLPDTSPDGVPAARFRAQKDGLINDHVRAMAFDRDGGLWLGTIGGVSRYAGSIWQEARDDNLTEQRINAVLTDRAGRIWVGMERNGLALWNEGAWQHFTTRDGLPDDRIFALFEDAAGRIWVSTAVQVGYLENSLGRWRFRGVEGAGAVYAFEQDVNGVLWLAAENGLYRWTPGTGLDPVPELAGKRVNAVHQAG